MLQAVSGDRLVRHQAKWIVAGIALGLIAACGSNATPPSSQGTSPSIAAQSPILPNGQSVRSWVADVFRDIDNFWARVFSQDRRAWRPVGLVVVDGAGATPSACAPSVGDPDLVRNASPAFYCPADSTMYLSTQWLFANVWQPHIRRQGGQVVRGGDFAPAVVIAHEMGHAVQDQLAISNLPGSPDVSPRELQADCLAGVWSRAKYFTGQLEPGDLDEGLTGLGEAGDVEFGSEQHHGTPVQRESALLTGYRGDLSACPLGVGLT